MLLENSFEAKRPHEGNGAPGSVEILQRLRNPLAIALLETARLVPRFAAEIEAAADDGQSFAAREHLCLVDYLSCWLDRGDATYRALYLGERIKMAYDPDHTVAERNALTKRLLESDARIFEAALQKAPGPFREAVAEAFVDLTERVSGTGAREIRVLFVGDCLHLDVMAFLTDTLGKGDISILPHFVTDKNPAGAADALRKLGQKPFDLVFYSPFTYENGLRFGEVHRLRNALMSETRRRATVSALMAEAEQVADALARTFAVPIFIHNTVAVLRHTESARETLVRSASERLRHKVRREIDQGVEAMIARLNAETFPHLHKIDELKYLDRHSEKELGRYLYQHGVQHPARLGAVIAQDYALIIETAALLLKKKMVVCDLDNTLWDGVIGEGEVDHFTDRQEVLSRLKAKGVVLAIASKNDPANVHWRGGVLSADDFVYSHISWAPKVTAFGDMERVLNLKHKDFVFIDDRADERAMAVENYPQMLALDAEDARTWAMFEMWEQMLDSSPDMDRTQMYLDRAKRQTFEADHAAPGQDKAALFEKLGLKLQIRAADKKDIKRATELVNRTNQFNMTAARVTFPQMSDWSTGDGSGVYIASMSDNFGDMGIISVLVTETVGGAVSIPVFVLSCRVFGYGVETALLNMIKRRFGAQGPQRLTGEHIPTQVNGPCRDTYAENGFRQDDALWVWVPDGAPIEDPVWLSVMED